VKSSCESSVGNSSVVWEEPTSSEADDSANRVGSRSSSPLQVRTIIRAEEPIKLQQTWQDDYKISCVCGTKQYFINQQHEMSVSKKQWQNCKLACCQLNSAKNKKNKLRGLSPQANYSNRATAACRRSDCQLLRIEGETWSAWRIPTAVFSVL
jgi:hypothetical protein